MVGRQFASFAAVAVVTLASLILVSSAAATRQAGTDAHLAPANSGTAVVIDPVTGAILRFGASRPSPAKSGTAVVIDPVTGAVVRIR